MQKNQNTITNGLEINEQKTNLIYLLQVYEYCHNFYLIKALCMSDKSLYSVPKVCSILHFQGMQVPTQNTQIPLTLTTIQKPSNQPNKKAGKNMPAKYVVQGTTGTYTVLQKLKYNRYIHIGSATMNYFPTSTFTSKAKSTFLHFFRKFTELCLLGGRYLYSPVPLL